MKATINELIQISHYAADKIAYIQGGGGNTSVKLNETEMAVKASGCRLSDMGEKAGYVVVDYKAIAEYFNTTEDTGEALEATSKGVLKDATLEKEQLKVLRPSVEAGFHSVLKTYVVHTHSVYSNILCCSEEGESLAKDLFADVNYIWLPYVDPGATLTLEVAKAIKNHGSTPDVVFMQNHGVIVSSDEAQGSIDLHEMVNNRIRDHFAIVEAFPTVEIKEVETEVAVSQSVYVEDYFAANGRNLDVLREKVLYPDQLVYLNKSIWKPSGEASDIGYADEELIYKSSQKQAQVYEETLVAYLYVINLVEEKGLTLTTMTDEQQAFILGWESEAYRKKMLQ